MNPKTREFLAHEYLGLRQLANGQWAGIKRMCFTWGLVVGLDETGYSHRYCYESLNEAKKGLENWDGEGDPLGFWIVRKGKGRDVQGPGSKLNCMQIAKMMEEDVS